MERKELTRKCVLLKSPRLKCIPMGCWTFDLCHVLVNKIQANVKSTLGEAFCLCLHGVLYKLSAHKSPGLRKHGLMESEIKI